MIRCNRILIAAALLFPLTANAAYTLDWATASSAGGVGVDQQWAYGDTANTLEARDGLGGTHNVAFSFSGGMTAPQIAGAIEAGSDTPLVTASNVSGFGPALLYRLDAPDPSNVSNPTADPAGGITTAPVVLEISFPSGSVYDLNLSIGDIDIQSVSVLAGVVTVSEHQDQVTVSSAASFTATTPAHGFLTEDPAGSGVFRAQAFDDTNNSGTYDAGEPINNLGGTNNGDVPETGSAANVNLNFAGPVDSLTITYQPAMEAESPLAPFTQFISVSDLTFSTTPVPEPSGFLFLGLVGTASLGYRRYFRQQVST